MRQKPQKSDKNQGGKQKTQWDSNSEGSAGEDRRWEGCISGPAASEHIYNRKDKGIGGGGGG